MIWIQFSGAPDGPPSTKFSGADTDVCIRVMTKPHVEGIRVEGEITPPGAPEGHSTKLEFDTNGMAFYKLEAQAQKGKYRVKATASKEGYQDIALSAEFYYVDKLDESIAELDFAI
jgi:hypothetical protein